MCVGVGGEIIDNRIADVADAALHSLDARGLLIARNTIFDAGNNGIQVWRSQAGDDGTIVIDNRIEAIDNRAGGSGQYGNAHQRLPRRQRDRARQPDQGLRLHGGARQRRLQHPDRRQQHHRRARGRALCGIRLRRRGDRQQHGRRRRHRRLGHQFQRGRTARGRAGQPHPQPAAEAAGRQRSGRRSAASASRSRPTPR